MLGVQVPSLTTVTWFNKTTGKYVWSFAPEYTINDDSVNNYITTPILSDPIVEEGIVYIGVKGHIYALDAQTIETPKKIPTSNSDIDYVLLLLYLSFGILSTILIVRISKNMKKRRKK